MKILSTAVLAALFGGAINAASAATFNYHGYLQDAGRPANGKYDVELTLYSAAQGGKVVAGPLTMYKVDVHDGAFNTETDFAGLANEPQQAWLGVRVRGEGEGAFAGLDARAPVGADAVALSACPGAWTLDGNAGNPPSSYLGTADNQPVVLKVNGQQVAKIAYGDGDMSPTWVGGPASNTATGFGAFIGGGGDNTYRNSAGQFAVVAGGQANKASGRNSVVDGGFYNITEGEYAAIGGGSNNSAKGSYSMVPGGLDNETYGNSSFAAGYLASARHDGVFIWSDKSASTQFYSTAVNQFDILANGGVGINAAPPDPNVELTITTNTTGPDYANIWLRPRNGKGVVFSVGDTNATTGVSGFYIDTYDGTTQTRRMQLANDGSAYIRSNTTGANTGVTLPANGGGWSSLSDRNVKTAIAAIDPMNILERLVRMPVSEWSYKAQGEAIRHLGPMAQDFAAAFAVGEDDTHISTVDADGVALAAIQGLNKKVETENTSLRAENAELRAQAQRDHRALDAMSARLDALERRR